MSNRLIGKFCQWSNQSRLVQEGQRCPDCQCKSVACQGKEGYAVVTRYASTYRRSAQPGQSAADSYRSAAVALDQAVATFNSLGPQLKAAGQHATVERYSRAIQQCRQTLRAIAERDNAERAEKYGRAVRYAADHHTSYSAACAAIGVAE